MLRKTGQSMEVGGECLARRHLLGAAKKAVVCAPAIRVGFVHASAYDLYPYPSPSLPLPITPAPEP